MSNTVKQLGFIPTNRGEYDTTGQTKYYKDNVVQYRNGSYICTPVGYSTSNPTAYTTDAPYQDGDTELNANWKLMASVGLIDEEPVAESDNLVKSGGVYNELALGAVYDVSAKNPTAGPNNDGKWESLSALLSDANLNTTIPTAVRRGGMSVKFIQSFDNKYVQYNLKTENWSININDWEKVGNEPLAEFANLYNVGALVSELPLVKGQYITDTNNEKTISTNNSICYVDIPIKFVEKEIKLSGFTYTPSTGSQLTYTKILFFDSNNLKLAEKNTATAGVMSLEKPNNAAYCYIDVPVAHIGEVRVDLVGNISQIEKRLKNVEQKTSDVDNIPIALSDKFVKSGGISKELSQINIIQQNLYRIIHGYHEKKYPISNNVTVVSLGDSAGADTIVFDATKISSMKIRNAIIASSNPGIVVTDASNNIIATYGGEYVDFNAANLTGAAYIYVTTRNKTNANASELSLVVNGIFLTTKDISEYIVNLNDSLNIRYVEDGGLNGSNGKETSTANRCRTLFIKVDGFLGVTADVPCNIFFYNETKQYSSHTDMSSEPYVGTHNGYVRINCNISGKTKADANVIVITNSAFWKYIIKTLNTESGLLLLNTNVSKINEIIGYASIIATETGKYIDLSGGVGETAPISSPTIGSTWQYYLTNVAQGDIIRLTGTGGGDKARLWAFLNSENIILSVAGQNTTADSDILVAPQNADKLVVNVLMANANSVERSNKDSLSYEIIETKQMQLIDFPAIIGVHTSDFSFKVTNTQVPSQLIVTSKYTGNAPLFKVKIVRNNNTAISLYQAQVGKSYDYDTNILYLPPVFDGFKNITIDVEVGTSLDVKEIKVVEGCIKNCSPIVMHAHLGFYALETANSIKAFEMAGRSGFGACICNPFNDADGEIWCYHAGNNTIIYNNVQGAYNLGEYTTQQVQSMKQYNIGYTGYPLSTFDDYCRICAQYGMNPTLSMGYLSASLFGKLKNILTKYGLLKKTTLKDGGSNETGITNAINNLLTLYSVFGDSVSYELWGSVCTDAIVDEFDAANFGNARKVIEPTTSSIESLSSSEQKDWCNYAMSKNMVLSLIAAGSDSTLDFDKYLKLGFIEYNTDTLPKMFY